MCLTVADDRSTIQTTPWPLLVTQRRSPAFVTVAVMVVVAQLIKEKFKLQCKLHLSDSYTNFADGDLTATWNITRVMLHNECIHFGSSAYIWLMTWMNGFYSYLSILTLLYGCLKLRSNLREVYSLFIIVGHKTNPSWLPHVHRNLPRAHGTWHCTHQLWGKMRCGILH